MRTVRSGTCSPGVARYGWWTPEDELIGVSVFGMGNHETRCGVFGAEHFAGILHHHRLAAHPSVPHGLTSSFLAASLRALRRHRPDVLAVVTYADLDQGHVGTVYKATNALYSGPRGPREPVLQDPRGQDRVGAVVEVGGHVVRAARRGRPSRLDRMPFPRQTPMRILLGRAKRGRPALRWPVLPFPNRRADPEDDPELSATPDTFAP